MELIYNKSLLIVLLICFFLPGKISAQENIAGEEITYVNAIGLRVGLTSGPVLKHKLNESNAIEIIFGAFPYSYGLTALYERYSSIGVSGLKFYYGFGGHVAGAYYKSWYFYNVENSPYGYYRTYSYGPALGIDVIGGLEYKFRQIPLAISFDLKPFVEFYGRYGYGPFLSLDPSLGIKFTF